MIFEEREKKHRTTLSDIIGFYREQIRRFEKIGIGNRTEFRTLVTQDLIDITIKRMKQLTDRKINLLRNGRT